jgi:DNA-binding Lrp family transcriptional regulator
MAVLLVFGAAVGVGTAVTGSLVAGALIGTAATVIAHQSGATGWVEDNIIEPVGKFVGRTVKAVFDNPIEAIAKMTAVVTGNAWAIPLIDGASTLARGGDVGEALKATAISYVGGKVGTTVGKVAGDAVAKATSSELAKTVITAGSAKAATAIVMGQDPVKAFISGGVSAGVSASAGWINQQTGGMFASLPPAAQNVITSTLASTVSAAASGRPITADIVWDAVLTSRAVTDVVGDFIGRNTSMSPDQVSALASGVARTAAVAFSGGDVPAAIRSAFDSYGTQEFQRWFDRTSAGTKLNNTLDKVTGDYQKAEAAAKKLDGTRASYDSTYAAYSGVVDKINNGVAEEQRLKTLYDRALSNFQANETQANGDALVAAVNAYNDYVTKFNADYTNTLKPSLDRYEKDLGTLQTRFNSELTAYENTLGSLQTASDRLNSDLTPLYTEIDKTFVKFMDPTFNESEYRQIAGLKSSDDAYLHWLRTGKDQGLPTNMQAYAAETQDWQRRVLDGAFTRAGIDPGDLTPEQLRTFTNQINTQYNTLQKLKSAPIATLGDNLKKTYNDNLTAVQNDRSTQSRIGAVLDSYEDAVSVGADPVITAAINDVLKLAGRPAGIVGESLTKADYDAMVKKFSDLGGNILDRTDTIDRIASANATPEEIAAGAAVRVIDPNTGLLNWNTLGVAKPVYSPELGQMVLQYSIPVYNKVNPNVQLKGWPSGTSTPADGATPTGAYQYAYKDLKGNWVTGWRTTPLAGFEGTRAGQTLADLRTTAPGQFIEQAAQLTGQSASILGNIVGNAVVEFSRNAVAYAKTLDAVQSDEFKNTAGIALEAGGELLDTFNTTLSLSLGIDPRTTPGARIANDMLTLGANTKTAEWRAAVDRMNGVMAQGEGWEKIGSVFGAIREAPVQFAAEVIGKEILQEFPILLASGGTGSVTRRLLSAAGEDVAKKMGARVGLGTAAVLDLAESFGGAANSAYDTAYATAVNSGMTAAQAETYARDLSITAGMIGSLTTLASMGIIDGNRFERVMLNGTGTGNAATTFNAIRDRIAEGAAVTWREGVQESFEEGLPTLYVETSLKQIDPNRDVLGNVAQAALLGAIAGAGTAGGMYTGHAVADAMLRTNADVRKAIANGKTNPAAANTALQNLGITDDVVRRNILSTVSDQYTSTGKVKQVFEQYPYFSVSDAEMLTVLLNSTDVGLTTYVENYVDRRYLDIAEVKAAAAAEGVTLTDEQAAAYVGQKDEEQALFALRQTVNTQATSDAEARKFFADQGYTPTDAEVKQFVGPVPDATTKTQIASYVNPRQVTEAEARKFFTDRGYTPTDAEVRQFVGQGGADFQSTAPGRVETYVNPRQVTEAEARKFFTDRGYTPTDAEVRQFIGQGGADFQSTAPGRVETYVNPRQVTEAEARKFFADRGYTPTDAEVKNFVGQGGATFQTTAGTNVGNYVNPRQVTDAEARKFFADRGYTPTDAEVRQFVGQGGADFEQTAPGRVQTYVDPRQVTEAEARKFFTDRQYTPTDAEVRQFVGQGGADFQSTAPGRVETYIDPRQVTDAEAREFFSELGYEPTDEEVTQFVGQIEEAAQRGALGAYVNPRQVTLDEVRAIAQQEGLTFTDALAQAYIGQSQDAAFETTRLTAARTEFDPLATTLEEATQFMAATGYQATAQEIAQFVASASEEQQRAAIGEYVNPRQVTADEARDFLSAIGYQPTPEEVAQFTGQLNDASFQQTRQAEIDAYVDPRYVSEDEVRAAYEALGLSRPSPDDLAKFVGQYAETELAGRAEEYLPTARYNSLVYQLDQLADQMGTGPGVQEAIAAVKADLEGQMASLGYRIDAVTGEIRDEIAASEDRLLDQIQANEAAGMSRDDAIQAAVSDLATELGTTEATLLARIGETAESLNARVDALSAELGNVETAILDRVQELEAAGVARDEALQTALDEVAADVGTTREDLLDRLGETEQSLTTKLEEAVSGLEEQIGDVEASILDRVQELEAAGVARDEALQTAIDEVAGDVGATREELLSQLGETEQSLLDRLGEVETELQEELSGVEASILNRVRELESEGIARGEALQTAIDEVAADVGTTREDLLDRIGVTEQTLLGEIGATEERLTTGFTEAVTALANQAAAYEAAGIERDEALSQAIDDVAADLGTTRADLLTRMGQTEQSLLDEIGVTREDLLTQLSQTETTLRGDMQAIADLIGKPVGEVTDVDIDFVADLIAQQETLTSFTPEQLLYDVTGDQQITQADLDALLQIQQGTPVQIAAESKFAPTGLYAQQYQTQVQQALNTQQQLEAELETRRQQELQYQQQLDTQRQIEQNIQTQLQTNQQQANVGALWNLLAQQEDLYGQKVDVKTPDPLQLRYIYDFSSIFATPQQAAMFPSPYAKGGQVEAVNDTLLELLRGSR